MTTLTPASADDICAIIDDACASGGKLEIGGGFTRADFGAPGRQVERLSLRNLSGIIDYDPAELVLTAYAGTPLAEIQEAVAVRGQGLSFEPYGAPGATIGGVIGAGAAGSRRVSAGGVRDHLLGFKAISGRGDRFLGGAKVVKNVTGYDLPKLMCGAWGRLAVMTEVTLKVLPRPPEQLTLAWHGLGDDAALALLRANLRLPADVAAAAYWPLTSGRPSLAVVRLEGVGPSIAARAARLREAFEAHGSPEDLSAAAAETLWSGLVAGAALQGDVPLWRILLPSGQTAGFVRRLAGFGAVWIADWAGGLIWAALDGHEDALRAAAQDVGGHATLASAPAAVRARIPALHPQPPAIEALSARIRRAFDPLGVFEINRFLDTPHAN
jgi:glycolate oxidase FAD binding subunit